MIRIVFMGTPLFAVSILEALLNSHDVVGVVTQPDRPAGRGQQLQPSPVKVLANEQGLPVFQPKSIRKEADVGPILTWQPDMIIVAAFGQILRPFLLNLPPHGCLNVHASLLPRWRGASPIQHAIMAGDKETGITLMKMDAGLDTGDIYCQQAVSIDPIETAASLHDKLAILGAEMIQKHVGDIVYKRILPIPQDEEQATYAPLIKKSDGIIDWTKSNRQIDRQIRAMTPWPGATTTWQQKTFKVLSATPISWDHSRYQPGQVIRLAETAVVSTGDGGLQLNQIQLSGKKSMSTPEFLRGHPDLIQSMLGN